MLKMIISGDAMIPGKLFEGAVTKHLGKYVDNYVVGDFETNWGSLQERRLLVEQQGPEIEVIPDVVLENKDADILTGLFVPVSSKLMDEMPNLRIVGLARAGKENINLDYATKKGILAFNIMGRNAEAVSDFTIGMMLSESRNIARAHHSIKNRGWQKEFSNINFIPQLKNKKIGIAAVLKFPKKQMPWLTNWQHWARGEYVTGIEPGTHPPIGQSKARADGSLIFIAPGETKQYDLQIEILNNQEQINNTIKN